jgi:hypothetical protein
MSDTKAAWDEVGSAFSGLGVKLKAHFDHTRAESQAPPEPAHPSTPTAPPEPAPGATEAASADTGAASEDAEKRERDVKEAFHRISEAFEGAFDALGAAVRDPNLKDDVKHVGQSLGTALSATFTDVSDELRKAFKRSGKEGDAADADASGDGPRPEA